MTILLGRVSTGFREASNNLAPVAQAIAVRVGLGRLWPGTLNLALDAPYLFEPEVEITADEYHGWERLKLQRCCVGGVRGVIVRPETHETGNGHGPATIEIAAEIDLRQRLGLSDGDLVEVAAGESLECWTRVRQA